MVLRGNPMIERAGEGWHNFFERSLAGRNTWPQPMKAMYDRIHYGSNERYPMDVFHAVYLGHKLRQDIQQTRTQTPPNQPVRIAIAVDASVGQYNAFQMRHPAEIDLAMKAKHEHKP